MDGPRMFLISFCNSPLEQMDENCSSQADKIAHQMLMIAREKQRIKRMSVCPCSSNPTA